MQLNYALVCGYRFDVSIYRGRRIHMDGVKGYAEQVKRLLEFKEKYRRFFYPSKFRITELPDLPEDVMMTEYVYEEERLVMLLNCKAEKRNVLFHKTEYEIPGYGVLALCGDEVEVVE